MRITISALLLSSILFASCTDSGQSAGSQADSTSTPVPAPPPPASPESSLGAAGTDELMRMIGAYYSLKDALVATDGVRADETASKLMSAAELFHSGMGPGPKKTEIQQQLQIIMDKTEAIMATKADAIEEKRVQFAGVSDAIYEVAKLAELKKAGVYQQYCPMAMNDKGAYWLSDNPEIRNPYFGKKMMECGEVRDSL